MSTRVTVSRGALMEIRRRIELAERGKDILEMRRDQLIGEAFKLAREVEERRRLEERLALIMRRAQLAYLLVGPRELRSYSQLVEPPKVRMVSRSLLGVIVPRIVELERPEVSRLPNPALRRIAEELWDVISEFIRLAVKEAALELLCEEIGYLNRIVNSLERRLIPELMEEARYIKLMLEERSIEEFIRVKKLRDRLRERSWLSRFI